MQALSLLVDAGYSGRNAPGETSATARAFLGEHVAVQLTVRDRQGAGAEGLSARTAFG